MNQIFQSLKKFRTDFWKFVNGNKESTRIKPQKDKVSRILSRSEKDAIDGNLEKAINRIEGSFQHYYLNQKLHFRVAELYVRKNDKVRAGQYLFFMEVNQSNEKECIDLFEKSCGYCPTIILKKVLPKYNFRISEMTEYQKNKLKNLIKKVIEENGTTPNFLKGINRYLDKK